MTPLAQWQNFYMIVGSSAGALIGLQFVVLALVANMPRSAPLAASGRTYSTPTIVHFATVLFLAAALCAPWPSTLPVAILCAAAGLAGLVYAILIALHLRNAAYQPEFEDWIFHAVLPILAYSALLASACLALQQLALALYGVAAVILLLLLTGIHNAWDSVTYHVYVKPPD